jgi:hypothetical protein
MSLVPSRDEIIREARHGLVVRLRLDGLTYLGISDRVGLSISQCQRVYETARARRRGDLDIERHRDELYADIEGVLEALRPFVMGTPGPPDLPVPNKEALSAFRAMIDAKMKLLGAAAPKESHVVTRSVGAEVENEEAAEFVAKLAAWARRNNAINVRGFKPALPPGMTERVDPSSKMTS